MLPEIKTVLFCTQLGPNAAYIFRYAYALAQQCGAKLDVLHVVETLSTDQEALVEGYAGRNALHAVVERESSGTASRLERRLARYCAEVVGGDCGAVLGRSVVAHGNAAEEILRHVQSLGADLVVMGAHSHSTLLEAIVGTTAQKVTRGSPVPVLLVQVPEGRQELTVIGD